MTHSMSCRLIMGKHFLLLLAVAFVSLGTLACGEDGIGESENPRWEASPENVSFSQVSIGDFGERLVTITNVGDGTLTLSDIKLDDHTGNAFSIAGNCLETESLAQDESCGLTVTYEPNDEQTHSGVVSMQTNDPTINGPAEIDISTQGIGGELFVNPPAVDFLQTPADSTDFQFVEISNVGAAPLEINDIFVSAGGDLFDISFPETRQTPAEEASDEFPSLLENGDDPILMRVTFSPDDWDPASGTVMIDTNDPFEPQYELDLRGNSGDTCLEVSHADGVEFGPASIGMDTQEVITLRNCSPDAELEIKGIEVIDDGGGVFGVNEDSLPGNLADGTPEILLPGDVTTARVTFHPTEETNYSGDLLIETDDARNPELTLPMSGEGVDAICPEAVATGSVGGGVGSAEVFAAPQDVVTLSAAGSNDPDGTNLNYEWSVIAQPDGSLADVDSPFSESTTMELDIVGEFLVELTVTDEFGLTNCEPALVNLVASPQEDIHVQLVWETPAVNQTYGGPDSSAGIGVDLDLYYVHPDSNWTGGMRVYYGNPQEGWGSHGDVSLDIDDLWGEDPENMNHADPLNGAFYRVGVHYYDDKGFGATDATVRVYFGIDLYGTYERRLQETDNFWYVGNVNWNAADPYVDYVDQFNTSSDLPSAGGLGF